MSDAATTRLVSSLSATFAVTAVIALTIAIPIKSIAQGPQKTVCVNYQSQSKRDRAAQSVREEMVKLQAEQEKLSSQLQTLLPPLSPASLLALKEASSFPIDSTVPREPVTASRVDLEEPSSDDEADVIIRDSAFAGLDETKRIRLVDYLETRGKTWLTPDQATLIGRYLLAGASLPYGTHRMLASYFDKVVDSAVFKQLLSILESRPNTTIQLVLGLKDGELDGLINSPSNSTPMVRWRTTIRLILRDI